MANLNGIRTLYFCYFGLREPLVQSQVLPYLRHLTRAGAVVTLLTCEPDRRDGWTPELTAEWRARLEADGIRWVSLLYHKRPSVPATLYDIVVGGWVGARLVRKHGIQVVHGRAHWGTAM